MPTDDNTALSVEAIPPETSTANVPETVVERATLHRKGFQPGFDPRRRAGPGRPKVIGAIQEMLDKEHRNVDNMRAIFNRLRALAMGDVIVVPLTNRNGKLEFDENGEIKWEVKVNADARFMQLYLERLLGPAKHPDDELDFSDAPEAVIEYLRIKVGYAK